LISNSRLSHPNGADSISCYVSGTSYSRNLEVSVTSPRPAILDRGVTLNSLVASAEAQDPERFARARQRLASSARAGGRRGSSLREMRLERGWSQQKLADLAGMTQAQIANLEAGRGDPQLSTIDRVARVFGVTSDVIVRALARDPA
jgi:DNA-binding XRE family transcriptional regulator